MKDRPLTQQEFRRTLWRAIVPPLLLLAGHAAIICVLLIYWLGADARSQHSERVLSGVSDLERLFVNMETGVRGYLLTGREEFLQPYNKAKGQVDPAMSDLRQELTKSPLQLGRLQSIDERFRQWVNSETELNRVPPAQVRDPRIIETLVGRKELMDDIRQQLREMNVAEMQVRTDRRGHEQWASVLAVLGGIGGSIIIGMGLAMVSRRTVLQLSRDYEAAMTEQSAANQQFHDLAEAIPQLVWITDSGGQHLYFNRPWSDLTGVSSDQLTADGWGSVLHPEDLPHATSRWNKAIESGEPFESEYRIKLKTDGSYRWFLCRATPVVDKTGKRFRWFGSCTDIETKKQAERDRESILAAERSARSDLLRASRIKDQFLATLSHELRTPMSAILGWSRLLQDPAVRQKNLDRAIEAIAANAKAQARLIDDLLDMSRIITGKLTINAEQIDLRKLVRAAVDSVAPDAQNKGIALLDDLDDSADMSAQGDPARLQQVILNLLSNALKFTPAGGKVVVSMKRTDHTARIIVSDSGQGISGDFLPYVFDRFRQAGGAINRQHGGLGLGLAIVKHLVELHGGTVSAHSDGENRGATFTVDLPLRVPLPSATSDGDGLPDVDLSVLDGKRLLVVDDDADSAHITRTMLEQSGAIVHTVHSARHALEALGQQKFDALVSDLGMPEMDGYELIRQVRQREGPAAVGLPAVALTAFARAEDYKAALQAGYQTHLAKPVTPAELRQRIASILASPR